MYFDPPEKVDPPEKLFKRLLLDEWIAGASGDTTLVALVTRHHDVSLHSPGGTPAVLHEPIILSILCAIADDEDTVVQVGATAARVVVDTRLVQLELELGSVDGDRDWADGGSGCLEGIFITRLDISEASIGSTDIGGLEVALAVLASVGV